jgi:parvulin-like peptidyl-prolyl isomerase
VFDPSLFLSTDEKISLFSSFSSRFSDDPSVSQNNGELGWVSWGQVMPSFQEVAFSSSVFSLSAPVLTDYGYHLIFVERRGFSDYYYYNKDYLDEFSYKFGLQGASMDSLRNGALLYDSLCLSVVLLLIWCV